MSTNPSPEDDDLTTEECWNCDGAGVVATWTGSETDCDVCMGTGWLYAGRVEIGDGGSAV